MFINRRSILIKCGIATFLTLILSGMSYYAFYVLPRGELGQAEQWGVLQAVEYTYRQREMPQNPLLVTNAFGSQYSALGLPTGEKAWPFSWILLNASDSDDYGPIKMLPKDKPFNIRCDYIDGFPRNITIQRDVLAYLKSNCKR